MKFWNAAPLLRIIFPFIIGISAALLAPFAINLNSIILLFLILFFLMTFSPFLNAYKNSWCYGCILYLLIVCVGFQFTLDKTDRYSFSHFSNHIKNADWIHARIDRAVIEKEKSVKAIVQILSINGNNHVPVFGKALVYFQKDEQAMNLNFGDEVILKNEFKELPPAKNPGAFDYKKLMAYKNITQQAFLKKHQWISIGKNSGNIFIAYSIRVRDRVLAIFKEAKLKGDELAVASALLVGYTDKLDTDLLSAYAQTGAMHVLSVSGLHVGIVYVVLNMMLSFLDKFRYGLRFKTFFLILFLWFYAFISGASPSVIRAAIMLSFIIYAKSFKKNTSIYNTLAASALLLLLCDPYYLVDVGFQLSYLAVIGIVCIHPFFSDRIKTDNWFIQQFISLITVSIAAQLTTFPLSIYYFHQFPNYFLLTNLIAIPLSTGIIYLGILLMICSSNTFLLNQLSVIFSTAVRVLNASINWISQLAYAVKDGIFVNCWEVFGMYLSIMFLMLFLYIKKIRYLKFLLCVFIILQLIQFGSSIQLQNQRKLLVYTIPKTSVIDFVYGKQHVLLMDQKKEQNSAHVINELQSYWKSLKLTAPIYASSVLKTHSVYIENELIQFYGKRIVVLKSAERTKQFYRSGNFLAVDYVILSSNVNLSIQEIQTVYHPACIVFDSSNKNYFLKKWKGACILTHQNYYSVIDEGAFVLEF